MEIRNHLNVPAPPSSRIQYPSHVNPQIAEGRRHTINVQNTYAPQNLIAKENYNKEKHIIEKMKKEMRSQIQST